MTDEHIQNLFNKKERLKAQYDALGSMNTLHKTTDERIAMDIAYEKAKQEWLSACSEYRNAIEKKVKQL